MGAARRWLLVGVLVAFSGVVLWWLNLFLVGSPTAPLATVKRFFGATELARFERAYATFHPDLQSQQSLQQFTALAQAHATLFDPRNRKWTTVADDRRVVIRGDLTTRGNEAVAAQVTLAKHEGQWRIISYIIEGTSGKMTGGGQ